MPKIGSTSSSINSHLNNQSPIKELMGIPNQKTLVNHAPRLPTLMPVEPKATKIISKNIKDTPKIKETLMTMSEDKEINISNCVSSKTDFTLSGNDTFVKKEQTKSSDVNSKLFSLKTRKGVDTANSTSAFPVK